MAQRIYTPNSPGGIIQYGVEDQIASNERMARMQNQMAMQQLAERQRQFDADLADRQTGRQFGADQAALDRSAREALQGTYADRSAARLGEEARGMDFQREMADRRYADTALDRAMRERFGQSELDLNRSRLSLEEELGRGRMGQNQQRIDMERQRLQGPQQRAKDEAARLMLAKMQRDEGMRISQDEQAREMSAMTPQWLTDIYNNQGAEAFFAAMGDPDMAVPGIQGQLRREQERQEAIRRSGQMDDRARLFVDILRDQANQYMQSGDEAMTQKGIDILSTLKQWLGQTPAGRVEGEGLLAAFR